MNARLMLLEVRRALRTPRFVFFTVAFPILFFSIFAGLMHDCVPHSLRGEQRRRRLDRRWWVEDGGAKPVVLATEGD